MRDYIKGMLFGSTEGDEALETLEVGVALALTAILIGILVAIFTSVQSGMEGAQTDINNALNSVRARAEGAGG